MVLGQGGVADIGRSRVPGELVPHHGHVAVLEPLDGGKAELYRSTVGKLSSLWIADVERERRRSTGGMSSGSRARKRLL